MEERTKKKNASLSSLCTCLMVNLTYVRLMPRMFVSYAFHKIYKINSTYWLTSKSTIFSHAVIKILRRYNVALPMFNDFST